MVYFKRILVFFLILFIFISSSSVFGFTQQSTDLNNNSATYIISKYEAICSDFVLKLSRYKGKDDVCDQIIDYLVGGRFDYYLSYSNRSSDGVSYPAQSILRVYFYYTPSNLSDLVTDYNLGYYNVQTQCVKNTPTYYSYYTLTTNGNGSVTFTLDGDHKDNPISSRMFVQPYILYGYRSPYVNSWLIDQSDTSAKDIASAVKELNDNLTNTETSAADDDNISSGIDFDTGTTDITQGGFNSIFNKFYNGISENPRNIVVPIPFANTSFSIDPNWTSNALGSNSWIITTINSLWYCLVGLYIYKDVQKLIEKVQNGSIANSSDTNIKTDML